ncbi:MAG: hypothetical protein OEU80_04850, partial [Deltaproteobacteria bacterium]|nr:hypothetical protein [Deltaproteobacteria bacterium]
HGCPSSYPGNLHCTRSGDSLARNGMRRYTLCFTSETPRWSIQAQFNIYHRDTEATEEMVFSLAGRMRPGKRSLRLRRNILDTSKAPVPA